MKNKKVLAIILCIILVVLGGVGTVLIVNAVNAFKPLSGGPAQSEPVIGNGGSSVQKGNYLYYVSGYVEKDSIKYKQNDYNKVKGYGALYRVKVDSATHLPQYDDYNENELDYYQIKGAELLVPKIAAFDRSSLYIFDNYLFYTSPNNQKDKYGNMQPDKIDFFRVNLNGANNKKVYTTSGDVNPENWTFVKATNGVVSLLIMDGSNLKAIQASGKDFGKSTTISSKADSFALPVISSYYQENISTLYSGMMGMVFFTEPHEKKDTENTFKSYNIATKKTNIVTINGVADGQLYKALKLSNDTLLYSKKFGANDYEGYITNDVNAITENADQVTKGGISGQNFLPTVQESGVGLHYNNYIITLIENALFKETPNDPFYEKISGDVTVDQVIAIRGTAIYFISGNKVYVTDSETPVVKEIFEMIDRNAAMEIDVNQNFIIYSRTFTNDDGGTYICNVMIKISEDPIKHYTLGKVAEEYTEHN